MKIDGFIEKIINVYRTQYYIVVQRLGVDIFENCELSNQDFSHKLILRVQFKNCKMLGRNRETSNTKESLKIDMI